MSVRSLRYNTIEQHFTKGVTASTDRDALAFLEAAQIYNTNQQRAIVNLVRSLKRVGLWSKMKAIYPFVGGTATSHKWNLKDPQDTDAAFRLTFSGGWTHSGTGAKPNGTNAYADSFLKPDTTLSNTSAHISFYSRTSTLTDPVSIELGVSDQTPPTGNARFLQLRVSTVNAAYISGSSSVILNWTTTNNGSGHWQCSTRSTSDREIYRNGASEDTDTTVDTTLLPSINLYLGARANNINNSVSAVLYSDKEAAFATIGDGLTDTDATNLYNIVDLYQKRLGRAV